MSVSPLQGSVTRRMALGGLGAGGLAVALAARALPAAAQESGAIDLSAHPLCGTWMVLANPILPENPQIANVGFFGADGSVFLLFPPSDIGPNGPVLQSSFVGIWEAYDEHRGHFTATQLQSTLEGVSTGGVTVDGYPLVSDDGMSFIDDGELVTVTIHDPLGAVVTSFPGAGGRPVRGNKLTPGNVVFPDPLTDSGTPTS